MGIDRRSFLKFFAGGAVGTVATPVIWKGIDDVTIWTQNGWSPRIPKGPVTHKTVVSKFCPSLSGSKVAFAKNNPINMTTDKENPFSLGAISAFAAAEVQMLYSSSRIRAPMKKNDKGILEEISWEEAYALLSSKMQESQSSVAYVSGDDTSVVNDIFFAIMGKQKSSRVYFMPTERQPAQRAWDILGGNGLLAYNYGNADVIVAIGANVSDSWGLPVRFSVLMKNAKENEESKQIVYVGSYANNTFTQSDVKIIVEPGKEVELLLATLGYLTKNGYSLPNIAGRESIQNVLDSNDTQRLLHSMGMSEESFKKFIDVLLSAKAPLLLAGSTIGSGTPTALALLTLLLTVMLTEKNGTRTISVAPMPPALFAPQDRYESAIKNDIVAFMHNILSGKKSCSLFISYDANPLYALPAVKSTEAAWNKISFKVAINTYMDETAAASDLVLPLSMGLESVDDVYMPYGADALYYAMSDAVISPIYNTRAGLEIALEIANMVGVNTLGMTAESVIEKRTDAVNAVYKDIKNGMVFVGDTTTAVISKCDGSVISSYLAALPTKPKTPVFSNADIMLLPSFGLYIGKSTTSIPPFNVKRIPYTDFLEEEMYVTMNLQTARNLLLKKGDKVKISVKDDAIIARVIVQENIVTNGISLLAGLGHTAFDNFTKNKGESVLRILSLIPENEEETTFSWNRNPVIITKV
ncbi:MAG: menaquinone reductase molybdopterin-binding-like subunit QrcB [Desulfovibrionaceae bacterium]